MPRYTILRYRNEGIECVQTEGTEGGDDSAKKNKANDLDKTLILFCCFIHFKLTFCVANNTPLKKPFIKTIKNFLEYKLSDGK